MARRAGLRAGHDHVTLRNRARRCGVHRPGPKPVKRRTQRDEEISRALQGAAGVVRADDDICHAGDATEGHAGLDGLDAGQSGVAGRDGVAPLGKGRRVDAGGAKDDPNELGGYSIVQAETIDAAGKLFGEDHPHMMMPGGWIEIVEIVEIMPVPGM